MTALPRLGHPSANSGMLTTTRQESHETAACVAAKSNPIGDQMHRVHSARPVR